MIIFLVLKTYPARFCVGNGHLKGTMEAIADPKAKISSWKMSEFIVRGRSLDTEDLQWLLPTSWVNSPPRKLRNRWHVIEISIWMFMLGNPIKLDDLEIPWFLETPICGSNLLDIWMTGWFENFKDPTADRQTLAWPKWLFFLLKFRFGFSIWPSTYNILRSKKTQEKCQLIQWWLIVAGPTDCINRIHYQAASAFFWGDANKFMFCVFIGRQPRCCFLFCVNIQKYICITIYVHVTLHIPPCASDTKKQQNRIHSSWEPLSLVVSGAGVGCFRTTTAGFHSDLWRWRWVRDSWQSTPKTIHFERFLWWFYLVFRWPKPLFFHGLLGAHGIMWESNVWYFWMMFPQ